MLFRDEVSRAVELQTCGYQLLKWLEKAIKDGFVSADAAQTHTTLHESAFGWLDRHYLNLPTAARPRREDLPAFSKLFATYLTNTFDLEQNPGYRLYSPDAHCFCPCCSWMVRVPHLKPKKVGAADKKLAASMKRGCVRRLADELKVPISDDGLRRMVEAAELREALGLVAYAHDLLQRLDGIAIGPASLALWRSFAWTMKGSPRKNFALSTDLILDAQDLLIGRVLAQKGDKTVERADCSKNELGAR